MKPQAIKTAYITEFVNSGMSQQEAEEKWNEISPFVDENGWLNSNCFVPSKISTKQYDVVGLNVKSYNFRPISLRGIETNNNWTSILSEKDLPSADSHTLFEICVDGKNQKTQVGADLIQCNWKQARITHWKKYEPTPDPIF